MNPDGKPQQEGRENMKVIRMFITRIGIGWDEVQRSCLVKKPNCSDLCSGNTKIQMRKTVIMDLYLGLKAEQDTLIYPSSKRGV